MAEGRLGGSDESFVSFSFAITSVILIVLYIPWIISSIRGMVLYWQASKKMKTTMVNPLSEIWDSITYLPCIVKLITAEPAFLLYGAKVCMKEKVFFLRCMMPKFLKFIIRPRIFVPLIWFILFSSVMYSTLTFDPYAVLQIPSSSSLGDVKKAYRSLSKRYHPDQNKTEEARAIYIQVRRAYKALVDRDAFMDEEAQNTQEFAVGVALPRFLTSGEHDVMILFGLLSILFIGPLVIWCRWTNNKRMPQLIWRIRFDKERVQRFLKHFGIPEDPKYTERCASRNAILQLLIALKIMPPHAQENLLSNFPSFPDLVQRCIEVDKNKTFLQGLGLNEMAINLLHTTMVNDGVSMLEEYMDAAAKRETSTLDTTNIKLLSPAAYRATRYLFQQHTTQVDSALSELQQMMAGNLSTVRKLLNLHEEMYELLDMVYAKTDKVNKQHIAKLMEIPQRVSDLIDNIEPDIQLVYRRYYNKSHQKYMREQKAQSRNMRVTQES